MWLSLFLHDCYTNFFKGGLNEDVDEKVLRAAFIPFGELSEVQLPIDYQTEKHRGFAFIDYELPEDAQAAIDNMVSAYFKSYIKGILTDF